MNQFGRRCVILCAAALTLVSATADAFEINGGVRFGGFLAGSEPQLAVSPHAGISWRMESGIAFAVDEICSILPSTNRLGPGLYNQTSAGIGYASDRVDFSIGPALSIYSIPACGAALCGRVVGLGPGVHAQASVYVGGPLGVSVSASVDWVGGRSLVLPGDVAATLVAGPVFRWRSE